jgi:hypothetical protein
MTGAVLWLAMVAAVVPSIGSAQAPDRFPFQAGERLTYRVELSRLGKAGSAVMSMEGPVQIRGIAAYALRFDFKARIGPIKAVERTESWVDLTRMASLRFFKSERHPFAHRNEAVELFLDRGRWEAGDGSSGEIAAAAPLDELSFMYFIRTLTLRPDSLYQFNRHFDARRNPTTLRVTRHDTITTGAGRYPVMVVEMRVRDSRRYDGEGIIRIYLSDDGLRLPVRIESAMPIAGMAILTLESHTQPRAHRVAVERAAIPFPPRE